MGRSAGFLGGREAGRPIPDDWGESVDDRFRVSSVFVTPYSDNSPSLAFQVLFHSTVSSVISLEFLSPKFSIGFGELAMFWTIMPKAGIKKESNSLPWECDVYLMRAIMRPITKAPSPELSAKFEFPACISAWDPPHDLAAFLLGEDICSHFTRRQRNRDYMAFRPMMKMWDRTVSSRGVSYLASHPAVSSVIMCCVTTHCGHHNSSRMTDSLRVSSPPGMGPHPNPRKY